jgi:hypothetical protein
MAQDKKTWMVVVKLSGHSLRQEAEDVKIELGDGKNE